MVEPNANPKTQLPVLNQAQGAAQEEESKEQRQWMAGTNADLLAETKRRLQNVYLNELEEGLLARFIGNIQNDKEKVVNLLEKLELRYQTDNYSLKVIRKVKPLF